jgi:adenylate kinase
MFIVFLGPPGGGKGTQAQRLSQALEIPHLSTGSMLREARGQGSDLGRSVAAYLDQGCLVPDEVIVDVVTRRLESPDCGAGCILDGFPRTAGQAQALDEFLSHRQRQVDLVLELAVDEAELSRRILARADLENRSDDTPGTIARRLEIYRTQTAPLVDYYQQRGQLRSIDGTGTPDEVFARIEDRVQSLQG